MNEWCLRNAEYTAGKSDNSVKFMEMKEKTKKFYESQKM